MKEYNEDAKKSLYNWVMSGVISSASYESIVNTGKVPRGREKSMMITYKQLQLWKVV